MKKLYFDYHMHIAYSEEAKECYFTIKCIPPRTERQRPEQMEIEIFPRANWERGEDSFGTPLLFGRVSEDHSCFTFHICGQVTAGMSAYEAYTEKNGLAMYRYPFGLTKPGEALRSYYEKIGPPCNVSAYEWAIALMHGLHRDFTYEKEVTNMTTTAEEAWKGGRGVCQDYAHVMIALCRLAGIPARYVTGMLIGEGFSHAWVEVNSEGKWYGLDPTNDLLATDSHIKLGNGRDASDCPINRGLIIGGGSQQQTVCVKVEEME